MNISLHARPYFGRTASTPKPAPTSPIKFGMEIRDRVIDSLLMAPQYVQPIKSGNKKSTVRLGINRIPKGLEQLTIVPTDNSQPFKVDIKGKAKIIEYSALTDAHARMDGFQTLHELQEALKSFYGNIPPEYPMTVIHFEYNASKSSQ